MVPVSPVGVLIGGGVQMATSFVASMLLLAATRSLNLSHVASDQKTATIMAYYRTHPTEYALSLGVGSLCSVLGGYVAARIANQAPMLNGTLSAYLCVIIGLFGVLRPGHGVPRWQHALFLPFGVVMGGLGGYLFGRG
jgi:hypothetical protein